MTLAVMQPYFFPYLGYFQLLQAADRFVVYDDVGYIKGGWINRNRLLLNGASAYFTVPLSGAGSSRLIREIAIDTRSPWRKTLLKTFRQAYGKAPHFDEAFPLLEQVLALDEPRIARLAVASLQAVCAYLQLDTPIVETSSGYGNAHLRGAARVIDVCRREGAQRYVNAIGGQALYDREAFACEGIALQFLRPRAVAYRQFRKPFVPWLSILDVLMFNSRETVRAYLRAYDLM